MFEHSDQRSNARERALYLLYEAQSKGISPGDALAMQVIVPDQMTSGLVHGVGARLEELDAMIADKAKGWTLERMPVIDLNVMRLGLYELLHRPDVPTAVVLDEAVQLAKQFSTDDSGRFVNGVLAALVDSARPAATDP